MAQRLRIALEMYEVGEQMQRQRLKRSHPRATDAELDAMVRSWLVRAPVVDHPGRPSRRFN